jgi:glycosyltransferase involved in cell wall biosynthesis
MLIKNKNFIIFGEDFGRHPHALEHLLKPMISQNKFLWVETMGLRTPKFNLYDLKRALQKIKGWLVPQKTLTDSVVIPPTVHIIRPFMIPFNNINLIRAFNKYSVLKAVRKTLKDLNMNECITVASVPNAADYIGEFNERLKVYYCVDDFSLWPGLDYDLVQTLEQDLLAKVDIVFATADALVDSRKTARLQPQLLSHGVEYSHFNIGCKGQWSEPKQITYFGLFDERSDQALVSRLAQEFKDVQINIFGPVVCDISVLSQCANIKFHGRVVYTDLPKEIANSDIFILPYVRNQLTENINPLKLKEYLSTSRPVVATALPEVVKYRDYLMVADNHDEFVAAVRSALLKPAPEDRTSVAHYIRDHETWTAKAEIFSKAMLTQMG